VFKGPEKRRSPAPHCYPLVTPLDAPISANLRSKEGENVSPCSNALQQGELITFKN
jgi:hypothetical protein